MELLDNPLPAAAAAQVPRGSAGAAGARSRAGQGRAVGLPELPVLQLWPLPAKKFDGSPNTPETPVFAPTLKCCLINIHGMLCAVEAS